MAKVVLAPAAQQQLAKLPGGMLRRINDVLERLQKWPEVSGAELLRKELQGSFRIRAGDWRVLFRASADEVTVFAIDNRRDVYKR